jgi:hypothetical protein
MMSVVLAVVLYTVKYDAQVEIRRIKVLKVEIRKEAETINILRAEWSYLNQPERLKRLAERYTKLMPLNANQIVTVNNLPERRRESEDFVEEKRLGGFAENGTGAIGVQ